MATWRKHLLQRRTSFLGTDQHSLCVVSETLELVIPRVAMEQLEVLSQFVGNHDSS